LIFGALVAFLLKCWKANLYSLGKTVSTFFPTSPKDLLSLCCAFFALIDVNQFSIITELLGTPPDDVIATICSENVGIPPYLSPNSILLARI
jgi:hypothetical protein